MGHVISEEGVTTDPAKTEKFKSWPTPTTQSQLRQFLGLASYYRRFVRDLATICRPLHRLIEKGSSFNWTEECQEAFDTLRLKLTTLSFQILSSHSSWTQMQVILGFQLCCRKCDGRERVIAYASRTLSKAERNFSVTQRELLAVITFVCHFHQYLLRAKFTLQTDHNSLKWLHSFKQPEGQVAQWLEKLAEFSFNIEHRPGRKHSNADALSRVLPVFSAQLTSGTLYGFTMSNLRDFQLHYGTISPVLTTKAENSEPSEDSIAQYSIETRRLFQMWDQLVVEEGVLLCLFVSTTGTDPTVKQLVVPKCLHQSILENINEGATGGHLGQAKALGKLKMQFYWPGHYRDVQTSY